MKNSKRIGALAKNSIKFILHLIDLKFGLRLPPKVLKARVLKSINEEFRTDQSSTSKPFMEIIKA